MATLTGQTIAATYDALLKVTDNGPITSSLKLITDGLGNNTALSLSSVSASITGTLSVTSTIGASNLSGTNTGDETNATIKTKLGAASASQDGYLTSTDWSTFNNKVPASRTLTINGTAYDLSADRSWTISAGISGSGTVNYLPIFSGSTAIGNSIAKQISGTLRVDGNNVAGYGLDVRNVTNGDGINVFVTDDGINSFGGLRGVIGASDTGVGLVSSSNSGIGLQVVSSTGILAEFYNTTTKVVDISNAGNITANQFIKSGGTSSQFLKANGSVDSTTYTPTSRTLTINGTSYDLSADRSWTVSGGISGSGTTNYISKFTSSSAIGNSLIYNDANSVLINDTFNIASNYKLQVTGDIYTSGSIAIGSVSSVSTKLLGLGRSITGAATAYGITFEGNIESTVTTNGIVYRSYPIVTGGTLSAITHYIASKNAFIGGSSVTNQYGFFADASVIDATNNYGFYGNIASATGRWNLYMNGTAQNYINGNLGIGVTVPTVKLDVSGAGLFSSSVTAGSFIKSGGTSAQLLAGDGSVVTAGTNITISGGTISASGTSQWTTSGSNIYYNSGNVGIGTASPAYKLDVIGSVRATNGLQFGGSSGGASQGQIAVSAGQTYFDYLGFLAFRQDFGASESMRITSGGNVGIGTTSPNGKFDIREANRVFDGYGNLNIFTTDAGIQNVGGSIALGGDSFGGTTPYPFAKIQGVKEGGGAWSGAMILGTTQSNSAVTEKMRITSAGNVGIGTTSPASRLSVWNGEITISNLDASYTVPMGSVGAFNDDASNGGLVFKTSTSGTLNERLRIQANGLLLANPLTTTSLVTALFTKGNSDANFRAGFANGSGSTNNSEHAKVGMWYGTSGNPVCHLGFLRGGSANSDGITFNVNNTENMRIASDGRFQVNNTGYSSNCTTTLRALTGTSTDRILECITISYSAAFYVQNNGSYYFAGSNLSDARTKKDINYLEESILDKVMKLKPASFRYKENEENIKGGFIAQDIKKIFPDLVTATKSDDEMMGVDYYGVIAILTKAIQELTEKVNKLENK